MSGTLKKLKKLKGRGLREISVRASQAAHAYAGRRGWSALSRVPSDAAFFKRIDARRMNDATLSAETLLAHFRAGRGSFFASFDDTETTRAELRRRISPRVSSKLIARSDNIIANRFDLLGLRDVSFGQPVDWHLEPVSGKRTTLAHWSRLDYLDPEVAGDKKITWELNRHQHFMVLGRAYWQACDERYAAAFASQLAAWMDANPPQQGINWASSLEVAFRAISWLWALHFFRESPHLTPELFLRALKYLHVHARHLETYLSTYFSPNTHLTGEALGLYYLGTALPALRTSARWRETGRRVLLDELARQVRADGTYFEQTTYYHRYTTDFYTHFLILARVSGDTIEASVKEKLCALLDFLMHATRPDGTTPLFGDDDGGRLAQLCESAPDDFRATLATGAALFSREDYKYVAGVVEGNGGVEVDGAQQVNEGNGAATNNDDAATEETLWLLGRDGTQTLDALAAQMPATKSRAFSDGGFYILRDGWRRQSNFMLIDCGPHGSLSYGHAHADALSFDVAARGRTLLVDPGTYTYTGSAEARDYFRSSAAHNSLVIDGASSSVHGKTFTWRHVANCERRAWISRPRFDFFEGAHDGYARLDSPAHVTRSVLFLKEDYWIVRDCVETAGAHHYDGYLHFAAGTDVSIETSGASVAVIAHEKIDNDSAGHNPALEIYATPRDGVWREEEGWVSNCYGRRERAPGCARACDGVGAQDFISFLVPRAAHESSTPRRFSELEAVGGRAFEFESERFVDQLLLGDGNNVERVIETATGASNFDWAWTRFKHGTRTLVEFIVIGGSRFELDGEVLMTSVGESNVAYCAARWVSDELIVDTDAGESRALSFDIATHGARRISVNGASFALDGERGVARIRGGKLSEESRASHVDELSIETPKSEAVV